MNRAFQTWSPRTRPLIYDSLQQDIGCQNANGVGFFSAKGFNRICVAEHDADPKSIFNRPDTVSYATGPLSTGDPLPWSTRWAAWATASGVRIAKLPEITLPANAIGNKSTMFGTASPSKVSIAFTSKGLIALAIQKTSQSIEVRRFTDESGTIATATFLGTSGVLFQTATLGYGDDENEGDLVVFYLRREVPRTVFARFERENFGTEHVINENLQGDVARLIAVEVSGARIALYGRDSFGRDVTLYTPAYILGIDGDKVALSASVFGGTYRTAAVKATTALDRTKLSVSVFKGAYSDPIQEPPAVLSGDSVALTVSIESGEYV